MKKQGKGKMAEKKKKPLIIAQISDIHAGSPFFITNLLTRTIFELNELKPNVVIVTGDITTMGFRQEYTTAKSFINQIKCKNIVVVPGNHDARNVGWVHFEDLFGPRSTTLDVRGATIVAIDSSEPDLDIGRIGRETYKKIAQSFKGKKGVRIFAMHHHLISVPGTGRERNIIYDAGDVLEVLQNNDVDLVLSGHKHVPWAWRFEDMVVTTAATTSTLKLRGHIKPSYSIYEILDNKITMYRKYPFGEKELIGSFSKGKNKKFYKWNKTDLRSLIGT